MEDESSFPEWGLLIPQVAGDMHKTLVLKGFCVTFGRHKSNFPLFGLNLLDLFAKACNKRFLDNNISNRHFIIWRWEGRTYIRHSRFDADGAEDADDMNSLLSEFCINQTILPNGKVSELCEDDEITLFNPKRHPTCPSLLHAIY